VTLLCGVIVGRVREAASRGLAEGGAAAMSPFPITALTSAPCASERKHGATPTAADLGRQEHNHQADREVAVCVRSSLQCNCRPLAAHAP
jgi:hypothetical protein